MTSVPDTTAMTAEAAVAAFFARDGYRRIEPAILQPVEAFLELSGEDLRRRMFVTQDADGRELCLRPEYTIPVCQAYLAGAAGRPAGYSYQGLVFRHRGSEAGEFPQAGIESFGRTDREDAEAEILAKAIRAADILGLKDPRVRLGDMAVLHRLLDALQIGGGTRRRLLRAIVGGQGIQALAAEASADNDSAHPALLEAIAGLEPQAARALVEDVLSIAGIAQVGGRSAAAIAARFLDRAGEGDARLTAETRTTLDRFLAIAGSPQETLAALSAFSAETGIDLGDTLDALAKRWDGIAAHGVDLATLTFETRFARNLDYYTGFVFEIVDPGAPEGAKQLGGGGRYDRLLSHLGAPEPIPAVGCSLWLDRFAARRQTGTPAGGAT